VVTMTRLTSPQKVKTKAKWLELKELASRCPWSLGHVADILTSSQGRSAEGQAGAVPSWWM
jgi:hypothetical protein